MRWWHKNRVAEISEAAQLFQPTKRFQCQEDTAKCIIILRVKGDKMKKNNKLVSETFNNPFKIFSIEVFDPEKNI